MRTGGGLMKSWLLREGKIKKFYLKEMKEIRMTNKIVMLFLL